MGWAEVWAGSPRCHPPGSGGDGGTSKGSSWGLTKGHGDLGPPSPPWHGSACTQQRCAARRGCPLCPWAPREVPPSSCLAESFGQPPIPKGGKTALGCVFPSISPQNQAGRTLPSGHCSHGAPWSWLLASPSPLIPAPLGEQPQHTSPTCGSGLGAALIRGGFPLCTEPRLRVCGRGSARRLRGSARGPEKRLYAFVRPRESSFFTPSHLCLAAALRLREGSGAPARGQSALCCSPPVPRRGWKWSKTGESPLAFLPALPVYGGVPLLHVTAAGDARTP